MNTGTAPELAPHPSQGGPHHALPGVGQNLMDHSITSIQVGCRKPVSLYRHLNPLAQAGMAVLDPQCRVIGVEGLRVVDASVMPMIPSCNLNGPTLMIGEKAAGLIAGRVPLPASNLPYFVDPHWRTRQRSAA